MSSGGTDRICQNDASAERPRIRSCHALATVWPSTSSGTRTGAGQEASRPCGRSTAAGAVAAATAGTAVASPDGSTVLTGPVCPSRTGRGPAWLGTCRAGPSVGLPARCRGGRCGWWDAPDDRLGGVVGLEVLPLDLRAVQVLEDSGHDDVEALRAGLRLARTVVR